MDVAADTPERTDKTFAIAMAIVAALGLLEAAAIAWHFIDQARVRRAAAQPTQTATQPAEPAVIPPAVAQATAAPALPQSSATPVPATAATSTPSNAVLSAADRLLKEATSLRDKGDTTNALVRLQDAAQRDPKNANVLAEMAMIYESVQALDKSNATWRKIQEIGPTAGALYELAELKLKVGVAPAGAPAAAGPGFAGV